MKEVLGGERLGSGKKIAVELNGYNRSTHNLNQIFRTTMSPGTIVPCLVEPMLPGDTFDIEINMEILTKPTVGPLYGSFEAEVHVFQTPIRLYNAYLHMNMLNIGLEMSKVFLPQITLEATDLSEVELDMIDTAQINPSCVLAYTGIRGIGVPQPEFPQERGFNALPILMLWDIYKNYYANKQEKIGAVVHYGGMGESVPILEATLQNASADISQNISGYPTAGTTTVTNELRFIEIDGDGGTPNANTIMLYLTGIGWISLFDLCTGNIAVTGTNQITGTVNTQRWGFPTIKYLRTLPNTESATVAPNVVTFDLENIDQMRLNILQNQSMIAPYVINDADLQPYSYLYGKDSEDRPFALNAQEGLPVKTYNSDMFNNWLAQEFIDYITDISAVAVIGGQFTIDSLNIAEKVYNILNRVAVGGGSYGDWVRVIYDQEMFMAPESPVYMGGLIRKLVFQEVISNATAETEPLGTLGGRGKLQAGQKGGKVIVKTKEPSYLMAVVSITPNIDYSQGNQWHVNLLTMDDFHKPQLDQIGFQNLITEQMAWWETTGNTVAWIQKSAGFQPAWLNYMTAINKVYGNFAIPDSEMFMVLTRRYEYDGTGIKDLTTYIDPAKYNNIFAQTSLDAMNFWTQIGFKIEARRVMSAKVMPNL